VNRWTTALLIVLVATAVDAYAWRWKDDPRRNWVRIPAWFCVLGAIMAMIWAG
jgi:hypothetical protein